MMVFGRKKKQDIQPQEQDPMLMEIPQYERPEERNKELEELQELRRKVYGDNVYNQHYENQQQPAPRREQQRQDIQPYPPEIPRQEARQPPRDIREQGREITQAYDVNALNGVCEALTTTINNQEQEQDRVYLAAGMMKALMLNTNIDVLRKIGLMENLKALVQSQGGQQNV